MSEILENIAKELAEQFDNEFAKAFVIQAGNELSRRGIKIWYSHTLLEEKVKETKLGTTYERSYAINFDNVDTSEHDAKVRAEERAEIQSELMTEVAMLNETKMTKEDLMCFAYRIKAIAEQMKEQKYDSRRID